MTDGEVKNVTQGIALHDVKVERDKQDEMWGDQTHDPAYWLAILGKQVGQLGNEVLNYKWATDKDPLKMFHEATQVAAVAVAFMEAMLDDRLSDEVTSAKPEPRKLAAVLDRGHEAINYDNPTRDEVLALGRRSLLEHHPELAKELGIQYHHGEGNRRPDAIRCSYVYPDHDGPCTPRDQEAIGIQPEGFDDTARRHELGGEG